MLYGFPCVDDSIHCCSPLLLPGFLGMGLQMRKLGLIDDYNLNTVVLVVSFRHDLC